MKNKFNIPVKNYLSFYGDYIINYSSIFEGKVIYKGRKNHYYSFGIYLRIANK